MTLKDIEDNRTLNRLEFVKAKTDSFLLQRFDRKTKLKFNFEFLNCSYIRGEFHSAYEFLNKDKPAPEDLINLTHNYSFIDKEINLKADIDIYYFEVNGIEIRFKTFVDSLKYEALNKIYNKGLLNKIKAKIAEVRFKNPYIIIAVDKRTKTFNLILKDQKLPHNFIIT